MPGNVRRWLLRVRMREIDEKREIKRIQLPLRFWACEIGAKWWAKRNQSPPRFWVREIGMKRDT